MAELKTFTCTSDGLYDRHEYTLVLKNGKTISVPGYEILRSLWYQYKEHASHVIVTDTNKGFQDVL